MSAPVLLAVEGLGVHAGTRPLLRDVSFALAPGESLTLLGESGAGKSLLAQAVMGNLAPGLAASGRIIVDGRTSLASNSHARRGLWGRHLALLPQEPACALDPLRRLHPQLAEVYRWVAGMRAVDAERDARAEWARVGMGESAHLHPWQVSGGMAQRAAAAIARAGGARVLLVDEPTKGLDGYWRERVVAMLQEVSRQGGAVVTITHDLAVARALGGRIMVLRHGEVVEAGDTRRVLDAPEHAFTRALIQADPSGWPRRAAREPGGIVLEAHGLSKGFAGRSLFKGLDLSVRRGERVVLQGPSGTGKSTLGNVLLGLLPPDEGRVRRGQRLADTAFQKLYQDPLGCFAPQVSVGRSLADVARRHGVAWTRVLHLLERLGVPADLLARRPGSVSGGELQRIALVRVLAVQPALIFADEPTSRLDPITQRKALATLLDAVEEVDAALVLVTHDEGIARSVGTSTISFGTTA